MTPIAWPSVVFLLAALALPLSALARRKLAWRKGAAMALVWVGIFGLVALVFRAIAR